MQQRFERSKKAPGRNSGKDTSARRGARKQSSQSFKRLKYGVPRSARFCSKVTHQRPYIPPEEWFEPSEEPTGDEYRILERDAGSGFRHVVTPAQIEDRLAQLPASFLDPLEVVQLSGMTKKKERYPLYGMQWGPTIYLYPMDDQLEEFFRRPPTPAQKVEARMYGARWSNPEPGLWKLSWTQSSIEDFYLNNVLIHELGHLLDERNSSVADREAFAEWFAIEYGYNARRNNGFRRHESRPIRRRHGSKTGR